MDVASDNLGYWCHEAASRTPDAIAIIDLCGDAERVTRYGDLERRLDAVATWCAAAGLRPGDRLAMAVGNRTEFVEIMFGAMRAGVVPVPLNTRLGPTVLEHILRDADCRAALVEPSASRHIIAVAESLGVGIRVALDDPPPGWNAYEAEISAFLGRSFNPPDLAPDHPSFQPYTSGSTGMPKGVILTHAGQMWWIRALQKYWPMSSRTRALVAVPLYHKNAMAGAVKPMLHIGGSVVLLPDFEPRRFLETLAQYRCTRAGAVPTVFTQLLQQHDLIESLDFSALETLSIGSAPVQEELLTAVKRTFGCRVSESYGLTEGGPVMIGAPVDGRAVPPGSCGVAWPEGDVKLVGPDGEETSHDGELWVRNPGVTPGYHNRPDVNAEKIRDGWLATGDLFHRDDEGFFYFRGRVDDMFKSGGENIYPKEVENLLISHPDVYDASVVPIEDPLKGAVPVALVMCEPGARVTEEELRQYALDHGPAYAHPRRILFTERMPLSGAAKVDRKRVAEILTEAFAEDIAKRRRAQSPEQA